MNAYPAADPNEGEAAQLARALDEARFHGLRLRALIVAIRDEIADGNADRALLMCNQALSEADATAEVVALLRRARGGNAGR